LTRREKLLAKPFTAADFRAELIKIMPGYNWTIHRASKDAARLIATGIQSSGFNRISTLRVTRTTEQGLSWYRAKSAGYGSRALFGEEVGDRTLARALRGLQDHYEAKANGFRSLAARLQDGRNSLAQQVQQ
jgi:alpha-D-ribose 1-methylphosphonate 5-triphosphate synthase subunit PhnG